MAVAEAPASNVPPEWNAEPDPTDEAPAPEAPKGALADKRAEAKKAAEPPKPVEPKAAPAPKNRAETAGQPSEWDAEPDDLTPAPEPAAVVPPSGLSKAKDTVAAWVKGSINSGLSSLHAGAIITGAAAKALDTIHDAFGMVYHKQGDTGGHTEAQDAWFSHTVDPLAAKETETQLGPDATFAEKASYGTAQTLNMVLQAVATGGDAAPGELAGWAGRAAYGAKTMTAPAAINAVEVGQRVKEATGDTHAAVVAAATTFTTTAASGAVPMAIGRGVATRAISGGIAAPAIGEAGRLAQNAGMPNDLTPEERREADLTGTAKHPDMQQPFDPMESAIQAIQGVAFGGLVPHGAGSHEAPREVHSDATELGQQHAAEIVAEQGGDALDQTVAATHAAATLGGEHDAAAVHQARMETRRAQVEEDTQNTMAAQEGFQREQDYSAALRQKEAQEAAEAAPTAEEGFAQREAEQPTAADKDADYTAARNEVGQEQTDNALGEVRGGRDEAPATLADALPPEQVSALGELRARLQAQREAPPAEEAPKTVVEQMREQARGTDDDFQELPPETAKAARPSQEAATPVPSAPERTARGEEELPEGRPPAPTAQTLAERRQAALDKAMAEKVGGKGPKAIEEPAPEPAEKPAKEPQAVEAPTEKPIEEPTKAPVNRLAAIRAAAEKRRLAETQGEDATARQAVKDEMAEHGVDVTDEKADEIAAGRQRQLDEASAKIEVAPPELPANKGLWTANDRASVELAGGRWKNKDTGEVMGAPKAQGALAPRRAKQRMTEESKPPAPREDKQFVARDRDTGKELGRADDFDGAKALREQHPDADIAMEGREAPMASSAKDDRPYRVADTHNQMATAANKGSHPSGYMTAMQARRKAESMNQEHGSERYAAAPVKDRAQANSADDEMAQDLAKSMRPGKNDPEVRKAITPVMDRLRPAVREKIAMHDDARTLPQHLLDDARLKSAFGPNGEPPRGVFDPSTGQIHIIVGGHWAPEDVARTLIHELAHMGNRNVIRDYDGMMQGIFNHIHNKESPLNSPLNGKTDKVTARQWMKDYAEQHGLDLKDAMAQRHVADEYAAHLADHHFSEPGHENPGLLKRIVQFLRGAFHDMGLKIEWTDQDILDHVRRNNTRLRDFRPDVAEREDQGSPRWMAHKPDTDPTLPPTDPEAMAAKFGRTMEEQAGSGPSTLRSRGDFLGIKGKLTQADAATMSSRLAFLHLDSLPDIVRAMSTPREFVKLVGQMNGRQGRLMQEGETLGLKWSRWANGGIFRDPETGKITTRKGQDDSGRSLHDLMHASTLAGIHPDRGYEPQYTGELSADRAQIEANRKVLYKKLAGMYSKLDPEGQEIYQRVRQFYADRRADVLRGLEARIKETGASEDTKKQTMADLRKKFEDSQVRGPYFPLARFGDHWARAVDPKTGQHFFSRFEDVMQRKRWLENAKENGFDTEQGTKLSDASMVERIDPDFVKSVMKSTEGHADLQDEIWQHYLKSMPEMSLRKNLIHRKGVLGFTDNALRAFNYNAFHSAHQIARLEYGNRLDGLANGAEKEADSISASQPSSNNALWAPAVAKELRKRLDWIKNPKAGSLASGLTKLGYNWFIGASPATAIRVATQNAMLAEPLLAARASKWGLGYFGAARGELWRAGMQWAAAKGNLGDKLRGDERAMFDEARAQGTFMSTAAQTLASGGADRPIGTGALDAWNRVSSFMFNAMEHKNRQTTALAMYRLARRAGLSHDDATTEAIDASNKAHFNYNNYNRPRVMQNDAVKVIGLFKQYPWQVTDRLARTFRDSVMRNPELSVADRNEQLKAFAGYMGKMMLFAGIKGVPLLYHATMAAINTPFGDEDRPFDAQAALREHLEQTMGQTASDAIMDGPMSALTGAALSHGASYSDLWYKQPDRDLNASETVQDLFGQIGGPIASIPLEAAKGADIANRTGDVERGAEHFTPPFVNHLLKANRIAHEGVTNLRGEQVVSDDELGQGWSTGLVGLAAVRAKNLLLQAIGFSPEVVARQYEKNTSENNFKSALMDRQKEIKERYDNAVLRGDNDEAIKWMGKMQAFYRANPGLPFTASGLNSSIRTTAKERATADHGVNMPPGMKQEYQQNIGAPQP
jgi:Large polyvalent protein associated domain 39